MPVTKGNLRDENQVKITRNYTFLLSELDGEFLADYLVREGVFNSDDKEEICCHQSRETKVQLFLGKLLCSGPLQAFGVFLKALRERYPHVAKKLGDTPDAQEDGAHVKGLQELRITTNTDSKTSHSIHDEETVNKIRGVFVKHIIPMNVLHVFHSYNSNVLAHQDIEVVTSVANNYGHSAGATELLSRLARYQDWYSCLLKVLCDPYVKQGHVVDRMWDALGMREDQTGEKDIINLVKNRTLTAVTRLEQMSESDVCNQHGINCLKFIHQTFFDYVSHRQDIGDWLADHGCAETCMKILREVLTGTNIDLQDNNIWQVIQDTLCHIVWNFSGVSKKFSKRLVDSQAVQTVTDVLRHQHIVENCDREVLMSLTRSKNNLIKVRAMLALVLIVEEIEKLTDTSDTIRCIVQFLNKAMVDQETREHDSITASTLTQCLADLAEKKENKRKIVETEGILNSCLKMLTHAEPKSLEQGWTAILLKNLAQDESIRQIILGFPGLVRALENLKDSEYDYVRSDVDGALKVIKGHT